MSAATGKPVPPMLATLGHPPTRERWAFESKWDGVRAIATTGTKPPAPKTDASILHLMQPAFSLTPGMAKLPAPKGVQRLHRVGARHAPLGKWPLEAAFLEWCPGQRTEHRQPLQRTPTQSYSEPLTSAGGHFRVMIVRNTKRKTTAVPAPTATPATASARRTPTVTPRTVAATIAKATSAGAGRGLVIALPLPRQSTTYSQRSSHDV